MKKYEIEYSKTIEGKFVIEAENEEQAYEIAESMVINDDECMESEYVNIENVTEL